MNPLFSYNVFGLPLLSSIELPALLISKATSYPDDSIHVSIGKAGQDFKNPPTIVKPFTQFNRDEFYYQVPDVGRYFVRNGNEIIIEKLCDDLDHVLLFFYSNCLAALLYQRGLIPFHVSGILDKSGKAWLFAATSRTGKSTTVLKLKERGYSIFTDDTAIFDVSGPKVKVVPSYPMLRVWDKTLKEQLSYSDDTAFRIRPEIDKFGIHFHEDFDDTPVEVAGVVFLEIAGDEIQIKKLRAIDGVESLRNNIYRPRWAVGMRSEKMIFNHITQILSKVQVWKAVRPKNTPSFETFSDAIVANILERPGEK